MRARKGMGISTQTTHAMAWPWDTGDMTRKPPTPGPAGKIETLGRLGCALIAATFWGLVVLYLLLVTVGHL